MDFRSARDAVLDGVDDIEVLRRCAEEDRIFISHDENTMSAAFHVFLAAGNRSPGLLLVPQDVPIGRAIESLVLVWVATDAEEWVDRIAWLPV